MTLEMILPACLLLLLLLIGTPVAYALIAAGSAGLLAVGGEAALMSVFQTSPYRSTANYLLVTVPMFILMAEFATLGGLTRSLFALVARLCGRIQGGLGIATVMASGVMAAISGSSTASAAAMARTAVPEMLKNGYSASMAMGIVSVAGTFAILIPPSIALVIYAVFAEVSIGKILMAGVIPGLLSVLVHSVLVHFWWKRSHRGPVRASSLGTRAAPAQERENSMARLWWRAVPSFLLIFVVLGSIYSGIATPTEASAVGALGALLIGWFLGDLNLQRTREALRNTVASTTMIFLIVIGAMLFSYFLTFSQGLNLFVDSVGSLALPPWGILACILLALMLLGFFMDQVAILLLTLPMLIPVVRELGFDLIWFGILFVKIVEIGLVTPPVGMNVFVTASTMKLPVEQAFKGILVLLPGELFILALLLAFPAMVTWLPLMMGP
jgi:tripartite ATP-independent transporter DctM subunit